MKKNELKLYIFGEQSISHVEKIGLFQYAVVRDCDSVILAKSFKFRKYKDAIIRTMYTGKEFGTGDIILQADTANGLKEIYRLA